MHPFPPQKEKDLLLVKEIKLANKSGLGCCGNQCLHWVSWMVDAEVDEGVTLAADDRKANKHSKLLVSGVYVICPAETEGDISV